MLETDLREAGCEARIALLACGDNVALAHRIGGCGSVSRANALGEVTRTDYGAFDLIIADSESGEWAGATTIRQLRALGGAPDIVVLITDIGEEAAIDYVKAGAADCVRKDRLERLEPAVRNALAARRVSHRTHNQLSFDRNLAGVFRRERNGRILDCNDSAARILGYEFREQVIGRNISEFYMDPADALQLSEDLLEQHCLSNRHLRLRHRNGGAVWVLANLTLLEQTGGEPLVEGSFFDVTPLKQAQEKNIQLGRLYSVLSQVSQAIVRISDRDNLFREVCRITVEDGGFCMAWVGLIDASTHSVVPAAQFGCEDGCREHDSPDAPTGRAAAEGRHFVCNDIRSVSSPARWREEAARHGCRSCGAFPIRVQGENAAVLTLYGVEAGFFDPEAVGLLHEVVNAVSFALDSMEREAQRRTAESERVELTERIRLARAQAAAEKRYRELLETAPEAILEVDRDGRIRLINVAAEELFGYARGELLGKVLETLAPAWRSLPVAAETGPARSGAEIRALRKDGTEFTGEIGLRPISTEEGPMLTCVIRDVTARKQAEEVLRESGHRVARILESITDGFFALDREWRFTYLNRKAEQILGRDRETLIGKELWREFPDLSGSVFEQHLVKASLTQSPLEFEAHGGAWNVWAEFHTYPSDEGLSVYFQDVTARKQLEEQLRHSQRLEAMGLLAGGVAHDFNNLLTVIGGYAQMTLEVTDEEDPRRHSVEAIAEAAERASVLTRQLLAFSRRQVVQPRVLDLNRVVARMDRMVRRLIGEDIELTIGLAPNLGRIKADAGQLEQVLMNLLVNARDAMPHGGRVTIETAEVEMAAGAELPGGLAPGRYIVLSIADTGSGMTAEVQSRMFEPFFTTKGTGHGTGLGLSTVYGIVTQIGGAIDVESAMGRGTTFRIYLPRVEDKTSSRGFPALAPGAGRGTETVLLVEDEPELRKMARHMLVRQGYRVLEAGSGRDALRVWRRHRNSIDLLLTDVIMPQMSGRHLAEQLLKLQPGLKVLYMSGYTDEVTARHGIVGADVHFLQKPFTYEAIGRRIRAVLDGAQGD